MMLSEDDKSWLRTNCGKVERWTLYILVFLTMVTVFRIEDKTDGIIEELNHNPKTTEALK